jgi:hypothetical protein
MNKNLSAMNSANILSKNYGIIITEMKMNNLLAGDEVYWNDPDEGTCSGHGTFVRYLDGEQTTALIKKDDVEIEVFIQELS